MAKVTHTRPARLRVSGGHSVRSARPAASLGAPAVNPPPQIVPLKTPELNSHNTQANKYYIFNETGNIMLATTDQDSSKIEDSVRNVFAEVSVFFAAMTRAISETPNPNDGGKPYSLYNYNALQKVIDGSGLFIHVTEEDVRHETDSFGVDFSKELVESLLGLATGAGEMTFASAMVASMGKEGVRIAVASNSTESTVANIVFVCEYLLGMPVVSAIVASIDMTKHVDTLNAGPCFSSSVVHTKLTMHKDTYMFVTPSFILQYASDLDSVRTDAAYNNFVSFLKATLEGDPLVFDVVDSNKTTVTGSLKAGSSYTIQGENFGNVTGTLAFAGGVQGAPTLTPVTWVDDHIDFNVGTGTLTTAQPITITLPNKTTTATGPYTV